MHRITMLWSHLVGGWQWRWILMRVKLVCLILNPANNLKHTSCGCMNVAYRYSHLNWVIMAEGLLCCGCWFISARPPQYQGHLFSSLLELLTKQLVLIFWLRRHETTPFLGRCNNSLWFLSALFMHFNKVNPCTQINRARGQRRNRNGLMKLL